MSFPVRVAFAMLTLSPLAVAADRDIHSFANPEHVRVKHVALDIDGDFEKQVIRGTALLHVERTSKDVKQPLVLDTRGLTISNVETLTEGTAFTKAKFDLGKPDPNLGQALTVQLPEQVKLVRVTYATGPKATALQWLTPAQTAGKKRPLLFTQSQAIDARSWVPLQDTPGVRITYTAKVHTPKDLLAVMSAGNDPAAKRTGEYFFEMTQPIPSYLMALAVGDLDFRPLSKRTGVYAEPSVVNKAATEFADLEEMVQACEKLYGPYRWERYDVLVMPPSFPFGGMENPRLTFASPTVLAGDKSLVSLLAHELAHSWSGNLVSNATWRDFWLNEGFTVHLERRIMEAVYGKARADAEAVLGKRSLEREMADLPKPDQVLHIDLTGRPPVDGLTDVPYEKGALFLKHLESVYGRERFDKFLSAYFAHFSFKSITTAEFVAYLTEHLLKDDPAKAAGEGGRVADAAGLTVDAPSPSPRRGEGGGSREGVRCGQGAGRGPAGQDVDGPGVAAFSDIDSGPRGEGADGGPGRGVRGDEVGQLGDRVRVAAPGGEERLRAGRRTSGRVPDRTGPSQVPEAAVRGTGEDVGGQGAGAGDLQEGPADLSPSERRNDRRGRGVGEMIARHVGVRRDSENADNEEGSRHPTSGRCSPTMGYTKGIDRPCRERTEPWPTPSNSAARGWSPSGRGWGTWP